MSSPICVPLICGNTALLSQRIESLSSQASLFEVWVDYLEELNPSELTSLCEQYPERLIFVFRRLNQEEMRLSYEKRQKIIESLCSYPALLDLDIQLQTDELEWFQGVRGALGLITSYHNYERTPRWEELLEIFSEMNQFKPQIKKTSAYCLSGGDSLRLLEFLLYVKDQGERAIVLGMGEHGVITRVFGSLWGNELTFASESQKKETAAGQLTVNELCQVLSVLDRRDSLGGA